MAAFSERLAKLMKEKGLTQKELSQKARVTESAMSYYVSGGRVPRGEVLSRIAVALNTTTDYLLGITEKSIYTQQDLQLKYLQRNLGKLDPVQLKKAENILKAAFDDIFDDEEE